MAPPGPSVIRIRNDGCRDPVRRPDRLRLRRREAPWDAVRDVDSARYLRARFDRRDPLLHLAQPFAEGLSGMWRHGEIWIHLLPEVRHSCAANMPKLRPRGGNFVGELPSVRAKTAIAVASRGVAASPELESKRFEGDRMPYVQITWVAGRTPEQKRK